MEENEARLVDVAGGCGGMDADREMGTVVACCC